MAAGLAPVPTRAVRIEFTARGGPMPMRWDAVVEPRDGSTVVTLHGEAEPSGVFKLAQPVLRRAFARQAQGDLGNLKDIREGA